MTRSALGAGLPSPHEVAQFIQSANQMMSPDHRVLRIQLPTQPRNILDWLRETNVYPKVYWQDRERAFEVAGVGAAHSVSTFPDAPPLFTRLREALSSHHPELRYYGGCSFAATCAPEWVSFGECSFVIPQFEILNKGNDSFFACNWSRNQTESEIETAYESMLNACATPGRTPSGSAVTSRRDTPNRKDFMDSVEQALRLIRQGDLEKIVLARATCLSLGGKIDPMDLIGRLKPYTNNAYLFCFQPNPNEAFVSMSPERLFKATGKYIQSEALAGTCPRSENEQDDASLGRALLHNEKNRREHLFVLDAIRNAFEHVCSETRMDPNVSLALVADCQHLLARIEGILDASKSDHDLLTSLHPTPAVGGLPVQQALKYIAELEPFDRGWYAAPIGWVGHDASEFIPGIRSARIHNDTITLYAGAGIVDGSDPEKEWSEVDTKIKPFLKVLR